VPFLDNIIIIKGIALLFQSLVTGRFWLSCLRPFVF